MSHGKLVSRRTMLATTVAMAATPALAEGCPVGPPPHHKGPLVFMDYDQLELDAAYDQASYEPLMAQVSARLAGNSESMRARIGTPQRAGYGPTEIEKLDIYRTDRPNAPIFIFIHGGSWLSGSAKPYGYPAEKGGLCMSGMYEMAPVRLSFRRSYVNFTDAMAEAMSAQRHIDKLDAPTIVTYGTLETPEFQRQSREFAAAVKTAGKPVQLIEAPNYHHLEMVESLGNPYGPNGRAALALMKLAPT